VGVASLSLLSSNGFHLEFRFFHNLVQLVEACAPELAVPLDPYRLFLQSAQAELAGPHAPDLLRSDKPRLLQDAHMLLHARESHLKFLGKRRDRSVCPPEMLQNAASGGVRERPERGIEAGLYILNHAVQYIARIDGMRLSDLSAPCVAGPAPELTIPGTAFTLAAVRIFGIPDRDRTAPDERFRRGARDPARPLSHASPNGTSGQPARSARALCERACTWELDLEMPKTSVEP
jgi:hypothetical protein